MKIGELAHRTGFSAHTLRYYEKIGLLPQAERKSGQRDYDADVLLLLEFIGRLKATGMPLSEMIAYARLRAHGDPTIAARRVLLAEHRSRVQAHVALLEENLSVLDKKISGYAAAERKVKAHAKSK